MFGYTTLRETWNTQWGPEPVGTIFAGETSAAPITLPGLGMGGRGATTRRTTRAMGPRRMS